MKLIIHFLAKEDIEETKTMLVGAKIARRGTASRLVSYGEDDDEEEGFERNEDVSVIENVVKEASPIENDESEIKLPPPVATKCSKVMQDKVTFLHKKVTQEGMDLNYSIQAKKNFRNPSIYEKLLEYCRIDEQGTNFPPHIYNPSIFGPESSYKALAEAQNENELKKKKKAQATKKVSKFDTPATTAAINIALNNAILNINNAAEQVKKVPSVGGLIKSINSWRNLFICIYVYFIFEPL